MGEKSVEDIDELELNKKPKPNFRKIMLDSILTLSLYCINQNVALKPIQSVLLNSKPAQELLGGNYRTPNYIREQRQKNPNEVPWQNEFNGSQQQQDQIKRDTISQIKYEILKFHYGSSRNIVQAIDGAGNSSRFVTNMENNFGRNNLNILASDRFVPYLSTVLTVGGGIMSELPQTIGMTHYKDQKQYSKTKDSEIDYYDILAYLIGGSVNFGENWLALELAKLELKLLKKLLKIL